MKISVLDHGYVRFIEGWGKGDGGGFANLDELTRQESHDFECGIIEAARQSTQGSFRGWDQDAKLLAFLHNNKHATPFEFAGMVIEVQAPIFVFREWHRHRTQSYNEMSARYSPMPDVNYRPDVERCIVVAGTANKQAAGIGARTPTHAEVLDWVENYLDPAYAAGQRAYARGLEIGIPKEIARIPVAVARYTRMRATANLRNWLAFLTLRMDPAAQWEIRQFANAVGQILAENFPRTWELFESSNGK